MTAPTDASMRRLARRVELALLVILGVMVYASITGSTVERLLTVPTALGLGIVLLMNRYRGLPGFRVLRWLAGIAGSVLLLGGIALFGAGVWLVVLGSFGILLGMVVVPLSLGMGAWGYTLLATALWRPDLRRSQEIDLEKARRSPAVRRFDRLHRPDGAAEPDGAPPGEEGASRPGSAPESDSRDAPNPT